ncbi:hypothetical protein KSS87_007580 [Heliosperma pusillum]|nr:hypothetical protein KSS87_007580 [Heliosperma pusillum]
MYVEGDACATCSRNCFIMHKKKQDLCSFFKIMFGETFNERLVLPPLFSTKLRSLEGRKITIEDSNRRSWDVRLSDVKGTLAFQKGWRNFASDHNIEMGDLLLFCYVGDTHFLVEIYGRSGCQKKFKFDGTNNNKTTEATKNSLPKKRPLSSHEQSAPKRYYSSCAFPGPNIDVTPRPKNVHVVKEPSVMTRNVPRRSHIHKSRPTVAPVTLTPVTETFENLCSMTSREKDNPEVFLVPEPMVESFPEPVMESSIPEPVMESSFRTNRDKNMPNGISVAETLVESCSMVNVKEKRPKIVPVSETLLDPCSMSNQDKSRLEVVRLDDTLVEPCFMTTRAENFTMEEDRKCLFDLSVFEMPGKLSTIVKKDETNYLLDLPVYDLPENEAGAYRSDGPHLLGSGTFENAVMGIADKKTTIDRDVEKDYLLNKSTFEMPENEYTNVSNKRQLHGNLRCQEPDHYQNAESEAGLIKFSSCQVTERKSEIEASDVDLSIDTIMPLNVILPKTAELSALSGQNLILNNRETKNYNQNVSDHAEDESFCGANFSISEQNYGDLKGKNMRRIKQELSEFKLDVCGHATKKAVEIEKNVSNIVKLEPGERKALSATAVKVICSDNQDFLELPEPLPVTLVTNKSSSKFKQQLVFLQDPHKRLWPVLYHRSGFQVLTSGWNSFTKANYIGPGDQCIFTPDVSSESTCTVQIDHLSHD